MLILPINILVTNSSVVINMLICYLLYGFLTKHEVIRQLDMCQGFFLTLFDSIKMPKNNIQPNIQPSQLYKATSLKGSLICLTV